MKFSPSTYALLFHLLDQAALPPISHPEHQKSHDQLTTAFQELQAHMNQDESDVRSNSAAV